MAEHWEFKCPKCGEAMDAKVEFRIEGAREWTRNETLSAVIGTLKDAAKDLPEQAISTAKIQGAIHVLERMP